MKSKPLITVALPTLGRDAELVNTIRMVLTQNYKNIELIVADQTDSHLEKTEEFLSDTAVKDRRFKYFRIQPPSSPAARNFILEKARGELILFIDDDIEIDKDFINQHLQAHSEHPDVVAIAGRVIQEKIPLAKKVLFFDDLGFMHNTFNCMTAMPARDFPGGNYSIKTDALRQIGGYYTSYVKNYLREESDVAFRLVSNGYKMYFEPRAYIVHLAAPYGGNRIYTHQYDNPWFFVNDLLFTFRVVRPRRLLKSLLKKYMVYTKGPTIKNRVKRNAFFLFGLIAAIWAYLFKPVRKANPA